MVLQPTILIMARPGNEYLLGPGFLYMNPFSLSRWQILEGAWCCSPPSSSSPGQTMSISWTLDSPLYKSFLSVQVADFGGSMVLQPTILIMVRPGNEYLLGPGFSSI